MELRDIMALPVSEIANPKASHFIFMGSNALLAKGLAVMKAWGFCYKTNLVWEKVRKDWSTRR